MAWTNKQQEDLNNSMVAAQNVSLGTTINDMSASILALENTNNNISGSLVALESNVTEISGSLINIETIALKVHRSGSFVLASDDTWEDIPFDLKIENETTSHFSYYDEGGAGEDKSVIVCSASGIFWVGGCTHSYWNNVTGGTHELASRIVFSDDEGSTWEEARCLQSMESTTRQQADYLTHPYIGTLYCEEGYWIKLQVRADSTDLVLKASDVFDNGVVATLGIQGTKIY